MPSPDRAEPSGFLTGPGRHRHGQWQANVRWISSKLHDSLDRRVLSSNGRRKKKQKAVEVVLGERRGREGQQGNRRRRPSWPLSRPRSVAEPLDAGLQSYPEPCHAASFALLASTSFRGCGRLRKRKTMGEGGLRARTPGGKGFGRVLAMLTCFCFIGLH